MFEWRRVPWPVWIFVALALVPAFQIEVDVHGQVASKILFPVFIFAWLFFLLKGVRWVWILTLAVSILGLVPDLITGVLTWQEIVGTLIGAGLLLLPVTRRYYARQPEAALL